MFGCYCVYCDGQPVGWLSEDIFSLREVGLSDLPPDLKRPGPGDKIREIGRSTLLDQTCHRALASPGGPGDGGQDQAETKSWSS